MDKNFQFISIHFRLLDITRSLPRVTYVWHWWLPNMCTSWLPIICSSVDLIYVCYVYKWICATYYAKERHVARKAWTI